jgi:hypothetical protein
MEDSLERDIRGVAVPLEGRDDDIRGAIREVIDSIGKSWTHNRGYGHVSYLLRCQSPNTEAFMARFFGNRFCGFFV